jgi:hypothetical protein
MRPHREGGHPFPGFLRPIAGRGSQAQKSCNCHRTAKSAVMQIFRKVQLSPHDDRTIGIVAMRVAFFGRRLFARPVGRMMVVVFLLRMARATHFDERPMPVRHGPMRMVHAAPQCQVQHQRQGNQHGNDRAHIHRCDRRRISFGIVACRITLVNRMSDVNIRPAPPFWPA